MTTSAMDKPTTDMMFLLAKILEKNRKNRADTSLHVYKPTIGVRPTRGLWGVQPALTQTGLVPS